MWNTVLFDLDGTLTDSGEGIMNCVAYALKKEFSIETEHPEELRVFVGPPLKEMFMEYAHLNGAEADRAVAAYRERYTAKGIFENRLYDGIAPMLSALRQQHFTLALASSKPEHFCREILRYFGIEGYFTEVVGSEMNGGRTKKADVIEEALRRLGMSEHRDEVVIVGDRSYDIDGAGQAGIASIGVTYGYGSRAELEKAWPDCIVDTPQEIVNVLIGQARAETPSGGERTAGGTRAAGEAEGSEASVPGDSGDWCCFTDPVTGRRKDARRTGVIRKKHRIEYRAAEASAIQIQAAETREASSFLLLPIRRAISVPPPAPYIFVMTTFRKTAGSTREQAATIYGLLV